MAVLTQTPANVAPSTSAIRHVVRNAVAGVAIAAGQGIFLDPATNTWKLADADVGAAAAPLQAVAGNTAGVGQLVDPIIEDGDFTHGLTGVVSGDHVWVFNTAGAWTKTQADLIATWFPYLGMQCKSATKAVLRIVANLTAI